MKILIPVCKNEYYLYLKYSKTEAVSYLLVAPDKIVIFISFGKKNHLIKNVSILMY